MRFFATIALSLVVSLTAFSQENRQLRSTIEPLSVEQDEVRADDEHEYLNGMIPVSNYGKDLPEADSLHHPPLDGYGRVRSFNSWRYPYMGCGFWGWDVHQGLNVTLGVSAFTSLGKNGFSGWGQELAAVYAMPLSDKLSVAVGGYLNNYSTGRGAFRSAGITAVLNYRFNEHWEAFIYGQKAFWDNSSSLFTPYGPQGIYGPYGYGYSPLYDMGVMGDRIGAGVRWSPTKSTSIQLQVEVQSYPNQFHNSVQEHWAMPDKDPATSTTR